ncbi:uncharacterized protein SAPINGB_P001386 [Magnusiomyces paraingens]|uniref:Uncharacterized protein n=1 Tax=Magnusiomyces paraingens TaxID=2606893 RepID=A0A5E8BBM5_9ASCO|nr:uncharacterized protein SAPINGB_P001386 [Saprochaete ingens]VVT46786.1 unnamed protein product [Saprochaete ingens]
MSEQNNRSLKDLIKYAWAVTGLVPLVGNSDSLFSEVEGYLDVLNMEEITIENVTPEDSHFDPDETFEKDDHEDSYEDDEEEEYQEDEDKTEDEEENSRVDVEEIQDYADVKFVENSGNKLFSANESISNMDSDDDLIIIDSGPSGVVSTKNSSGFVSRNNSSMANTDEFLDNLISNVMQQFENSDSMPQSSVEIINSYGADEELTVQKNTKELNMTKFKQNALEIVPIELQAAYGRWFDSLDDHLKTLRARKKSQSSIEFDGSKKVVETSTMTENCSKNSFILSKGENVPKVSLSKIPFEISNNFSNNDNNNADDDDDDDDDLIVLKTVPVGH